MTSLTAHLHALLHVVGDRVQHRDERGATAVEYGLMVGLIAVVIIAGVTLLGDNLQALFTTVAGELP